MVSRRELVHVDTIDLYVARMRKMFVKEAAGELFVEEQAIKHDLGRVLLATEEEQEKLMGKCFASPEPEVPVMTDTQRAEAMGLLQDPKLLGRILDDFDACGLVGERANKLICYLACVSRLLPRPLSVLVQSSSAAGKTSLLEATLGFMPPEAMTRMSSLTPQSLYYMGETELQHKILSVAEEEGVAQAAYALKLLQSDGRLRIACVGKDSQNGRPQTQHYEVEGPVAMLLTTTAEHPDGELANRCIRLSVSENPQQTAAIHRLQRADYLPRDKDPPHVDRQAVQQRHHHAQRLLEPLPVVIPFAEQLTFRTDQTRHRRDHAKYLSLIAASALLHQYQRQRVTQNGTPHVVATLQDLALANQLAAASLGTRLDELLPQTRLLLGQLQRFVTRRAQEQNIPRQDVRFTQRELREALQVSDHGLRRQLTRLVELEYVLCYRTGRGNQREYELAYHGQAADTQELLPGLTGARQLHPSKPPR